MKRLINILLAIVFLSAGSLYAVKKEVLSEKNGSSSKVHSVVILGGGVGGLTSGIYLSRAGEKPLIIEGKELSQITQSHLVENWPSQERISGNNLFEKIKSQAISNGCELQSKEVVAADFSKRPYELTLQDVYNPENREVIKTYSCIIATGTKANRLNITGEDKFFGKGVSSCALCDGNFYKKKHVAVVGGSDAALIEALYLSNIADKVYVIVRKNDFRSSCDQINKQLVINKRNIEVIYNSSPVAILGDKGSLQGIELKSNKDKQISKVAVDGVFLAIGSTPNSSYFKKQLKIDSSGYIIVDDKNQTSKEGVYAVGDIISSESKQAILAAAGGAIAGIEAQKYLSHNNFNKNELIVNSSERQNINFVDKDMQNEVKKFDNVVEITSVAQFEKELKESSVPVLVDFYATWCGPCKRIAPYLTTSAKNLSGVVRILKVDVDKHRSISKKYSIKAMPTLLIFDNNKKYISRKVGPDEILKLMNELLNNKDKSKDEISDFIISLR